MPQTFECQCITFSTKILNSKNSFTTLIIIRNVSLAPNQHIIMISEGSCDPEDWSNDAENSALPSNKYIKIETLFSIKIFHNITVFTVFLIK